MSSYPNVSDGCERPSLACRPGVNRLPAALFDTSAALETAFRYIGGVAS